MSMKSDPENFDALLKLLALKRHEQPPPGYFERLSRGVMARLEAEEATKQSQWDGVSNMASWLRRVWSAFEVKPILAGVFGVVVCGLMLSGIIYSQRLEPATVTASPSPSEALFTGVPKTWGIEQPAPPMLIASTNPLVEPKIPTSIFDVIQPPVQPVNFNP